MARVVAYAAGVRNFYGFTEAPKAELRALRTSDGALQWHLQGPSLTSAAVLGAVAVGQGRVFAGGAFLASSSEPPQARLLALQK